jgi:outer membrane protein assembly factor BamB
MFDRLFLTALLCVSSSICSAENWPQFRGPQGNGHSSATSLPTEWTSTKNIVWKNEDVGEGWSSPVVWENRIYLTCARPLAAAEATEDNANTRDLFALCIDAKSGKTLWDEKIFSQTPDVAQRIHKKNSHASPTPVTDGQYVWVHFGAQGTACLTVEGNTVWKRNDIRYKMTHGNGGSPVIVDDILFFSCDGSDKAFVIALDKMTGDTRWKKDRPPVENPKTFSFNTPTVIEVNGRKQILSQGSDIITAFDPTDGEEIWWFRYDGYSVIPKPVYAHGLVFLCTSYNNSKLHVIRADGKGDVTDTHEVWSAPKVAPHTPSPLVVGDELYLVNDRGVATCHDAESGEMYWQERLGGNYSASPIYADGKIYFLSEDGVTTIIKPGKTYKEIARNELGERTLASFGVVDHALLIRSENALYRIEQ